MPIAKNPKRHHGTKNEDGMAARPKKTPILVRFTPEMLQRIDRAAAELGISRASFVAQGAAEKVRTLFGVGDQRT